MLYRRLRLIGMLLLSAAHPGKARADTPAEENHHADKHNEHDERNNQIIPVESAKHRCILSLLGQMMGMPSQAIQYVALA